MGSVTACQNCGAAIRRRGRFCGHCGVRLDSVVLYIPESDEAERTPLPSRGSLLAHRYLLERELGRGGFGIVFQALDQKLGKPVAIKTIHLRHIIRQDSLPEVQRRFRTEARAVGLLNHPNIVSVLDYGEEGSLSYLVMDLVGGRTLDEVLAREEVLPERAFRFVRQILDALSHAHRHGVTHRDVKPMNILVGDRDQLKLIDFGISRIEGAARMTDRTKEGRLVGSPGFMAPEVIRAEFCDTRSDLYSAAVVAYMLHTSRRPFEGKPLQVMHAVVNQPPPDPVTLAPDMPKALGRWLLRGLAKNPSKRFQSAEAMMESYLAIEEKIMTWSHDLWPTTEEHPIFPVEERPEPPPAALPASASQEARGLRGTKQGYMKPGLPTWSIPLLVAGSSLVLAMGLFAAFMAGFVMAGR